MVGSSKVLRMVQSTTRCRHFLSFCFPSTVSQYQESVKNSTSQTYSPNFFFPSLPFGVQPIQIPQHPLHYILVSITLLLPLSPTRCVLGFPRFIQCIDTFFPPLRCLAHPLFSIFHTCYMFIVKLNP